MKRFTTAVVLVVLVGAVAHADDASPPATVFKQSGDHGVTITPAGTSPARVRLERDGVQVYERDAVNQVAPVDVLVSADGHVVTLGEWDRFGQEHSLVIYAPDGDVVVDHRLEELLITDELAVIQHRKPWRWWLDECGCPTIDADELALTSAWGDELRFRLADGVQLRDGKKMKIPSDRERLKSYLRGKRHYDIAWVSVEEDGGEGSIEEGDDDDEVERAIRHVAKLAKRIDGAVDVPLRSGHTRIRVQFVEHVVGYQYEVVLAPGAKLSRKERAAVKALRRLAGLK